MTDARTWSRVVWCEIVVAALVLTGDVPWWVAVAMLVLVPYVGLSTLDAPWRRVARKISPVTTVLYLPFCLFDWFFLSGRLIFAIVNLTFYLMLHTLLHQDSTKERGRLQLLCLFGMLAAASMTVNAVFAVPLAAFVLAGAISLMLEQTRPDEAGPEALREAVRTGLLVTLPVLVVAGLVFVSLPRASYGGFRLGGLTGITVTGFSEQVRLGDFSEIRQDRDVVMRILAEGAGPSPPRWRGPAYDRYNQGAWRQSLSGVFSLPQPRAGRYLLDRPAAGPFAAHEVFVEPLDTDVLFLPPASESLVTAERYVFVDPYLTLRTGRRARAGRHYTVSWRYEAERGTSPVGGVERLSERRRELFTQLPPLSDEFHALAAGLAPDGSEPLVAAAAVERHLKSSYAYSLRMPRRVRDDPIEDFLFDARAGHCEYFASGMVLLLRSRGIPARLVTGFNRGEENSVGSFEVVRKTDAHAWTEVFDPARGWVAFDPTPPAALGDAAAGFGFFTQGIDSLRMLWDMYVVAFDVERQRGVLGQAAALAGGLVAATRSGVRLVRRRWLAALGVVVLLFGLRLLWKSRWLQRLRVRFAHAARVTSSVEFYERLLVALGRLGVEKRPGQTALEFARDREDELPGITELTSIYYRVRFGGDELDAEQRARVERLGASVRLAAVSDGRRPS